MRKIGVRCVLLLGMVLLLLMTPVLSQSEPYEETRTLEQAALSLSGLT
ncbi:MAG: hypothetical protein H8E38_08660 [SAR324 cluster bacterium]|nr:hypothetical protein [SAR324 cluster bacterium]